MPKTMAVKRIEAEDRQREYAARSLGEQIELIAKRPGKSAREYKKLMQAHQDATTKGVGR